MLLHSKVHSFRPQTGFRSSCVIFHVEKKAGNSDLLTLKSNDTNRDWLKPLEQQRILDLDEAIHISFK